MTRSAGFDHVLVSGLTNSAYGEEGLSLPKTHREPRTVLRYAPSTSSVSTLDKRRKSDPIGFAPRWCSAEHGFTLRWCSAEHGFAPRWCSAEHGFTLIELMIALFIFGMIATAGVSLLAFSVKAQEVTKARLADIGASERLSALLSADLAQVVPRISRDERGAPVPAFRSDRTVLIGYVRGGWGTSGTAHNGLQRVEWRLVEGQFRRATAEMADGPTNSEPSVMAADVAQVRLRFRTKDGWRDRWDATQASAVPRALELTVIPKHGASLTRLFIVGTGT
jgi:general secretion pathway protein J